MYSFDDIKGNEKLKKVLSSAKSSNRVLNSYIIEGESGSGKMLIAKCFAKYIQCNEEKICNECNHCISFDSDNNPDVIYIKKSDKKATIGVDEIRENVVNDVAIKPFSSKYKIYIIKDADKMTVAAQNAFLKTLEEPPEYAVFILLAENIGNFLVTIVSRCTIFKTERLSDEIIAEYLVNNNICDKEQAEITSRYCDGSIGTAIDILNDAEFNLLRDKTFEIFAKVYESSLYDVYKNISFLDENRKNINKILNIAILFYRDALIYKIEKDYKLIINKDKISQIKKVAQNIGIKKLTENVASIVNAEKRIKGNANFLQTMEVMFFEIKEKK